MERFETVSPEQLDKNVFESIGRNWMLITAEKDGRANTMTASWGGFGVLWSVDVAYVFVRESRFTKEFLDSSERFSLSFPDGEKYRKQLTYLGRISGRDADKINESGMTLVYEDGVPFFAESEFALLCEKTGRFYLAPDGILDKDALAGHYPKGDFHYLYVGKVLKVLKRSAEAY